MSTWPPPSLETNAEGIVNECEVAEMMQGDRPMLAPIHMAALLYLGETVHCRHLWRRTTEKDEMLKDWWAVAMCKLKGEDVTTALEKCATTHPEPLKTYAAQLAATGGQPRKKEPQQQLNQEIVSFLETSKWNA